MDKDRQIEVMKRYLGLIHDIAVDYDGFNTVKGLKGLVDELRKYAILAFDCNVTEVMYVGGDGKKYNILQEEITEKE